jgi:hypothetical protein
MSTLQGDIQSFSLAAVNRMLHGEKKTGRLGIVSERHQATIYYQTGLIVFMDSDLTQDFSLGYLVRTHRMIGESEMRKVLEIANAEGKRLGVTLVRLGYLSKEMLVNLLRYQFKEVIATVLSWNAGTFSYTEGLTDYAEDIHFEIDPVRLLSEAQQWRQYRDIIPDDRAVFKMADSRFFSNSSFSEGVLRVMLLVDGRRTITQIIAESGFSRLAVYKAVKQLVLQGAIIRKGAADSGRRFDPAPLIGFYLDTVEEIMGIISLELGRQRALECLRTSLDHAAQYEAFLRRIPVEADARARVTGLMDALNSNPGKLSERDLIEGFDALVSRLLADLQRLLGEKAYFAALGRIEYPVLLDIKNRGHFVREPGYPPGAGDAPLKASRFADDREAAPMTAKDRSSAEQAAVLSFFTGALQILAQDLENEIGRQAYAIIEGILKGSDAYPQFLYAFQADDDNRRNVDRMASCLKKEGGAYDTRHLEETCRDVLSGVVAKVRTLLGDGAVQRSLDKVGEQVARFSKYKVGAQLQNAVNMLRE